MAHSAEININQMVIENSIAIGRLTENVNSINSSVKEISNSVDKVSKQVETLADSEKEDSLRRKSHDKRVRNVQKVFYPVMATLVTAATMKVLGLFDIILK